jgi:hypothetical protein
MGTDRIPRGVSYSVIEEGLILAAPDGGMDYFLNHGCDPNVWMGDEVTVVARRDIVAGEELLIDYALVQSEPGYRLVDCRCGAVCCRGTVTGDDWRDPVLRRRYRGHFLPFLERRAVLLSPPSPGERPTSRNEGDHVGVDNFRVRSSSASPPQDASGSMGSHGSRRRVSWPCQAVHRHQGHR